ncbi:MAG: acylphosphatase [Clostridium sp.]
MNRLLIIVEGKVQGVGFRYFATAAANKYRLTGSARNMDNGMVELYVQGDACNIELFISHVRHGNRFIDVSNISYKKVSLVEDEKKFKIIY